MNLPERPLSSNLTRPSINANSVSSLPRPTFLPGFHFVPRWRARMFPPRTRSPPNFFSPNRCEFESRPLRDEPTPFLCAIFKLQNDVCSLESGVKDMLLLTPDSRLANRIYLQGRVALAMALFALVLLTALLFEDDDL